jgi:hypothetical protein
MQTKKEQRDQLLEMISQWQKSGLTQKSYCVQNGIGYHIFHYWYKIYKSEKESTGSFLPVNITSSVVSQEQITITGLNGIQFQIPLTDKAVGFIKQILLS